jgi:tRNA (Thr-GGU) A37 N-methylase
MNDKILAGLDAFQVFPIGTIHRCEGDMYLEIFPQFRPALKHLEEFSHMTVLFWAHQHGAVEIFATRSELRPNPILSTPCRIEGIDHENGIIQINRIDGFDDSPILDIKGYFPVMDRVKDAVIPEWLDWGLDHVPEEGLDLFEEMEG